MACALLNLKTLIALHDVQIIENPLEPADKAEENFRLKAKHLGLFPKIEPTRTHKLVLEKSKSEEEQGSTSPVLTPTEFINSGDEKIILKANLQTSDTVYVDLLNDSDLFDDLEKTIDHLNQSQIVFSVSFDNDIFTEDDILSQFSPEKNKSAQQTETNN